LPAGLRYSVPVFPDLEAGDAGWCSSAVVTLAGAAAPLRGGAGASARVLRMRFVRPGHGSGAQKAPPQRRPGRRPGAGQRWDTSDGVQGAPGPSCAAFRAYGRETRRTCGTAQRSGRCPSPKRRLRVVRTAARNLGPARLRNLSEWEICWGCSVRTARRTLAPGRRTPRCHAPGALALLRRRGGTLQPHSPWRR
jgi:hypothetical protein